VVIEGVLIGLLGGLVGVVAAYLFFNYKAFTLGNEGLTLAITPTLTVLAQAIGIALLLGMLASIYPAWRASSKPLIETLNS